MRSESSPWWPIPTTSSRAVTARSRRFARTKQLALGTTLVLLATVTVLIGVVFAWGAATLGGRPQTSCALALMVLALGVWLIHPDDWELEGAVRSEHERRRENNERLRGLGRM